MVRVRIAARQHLAVQHGEVTEAGHLIGAEAQAWVRKTLRAEQPFLKNKDDKTAFEVAQEMSAKSGDKSMLVVFMAAGALQYSAAGFKANLHATPDDKLTDTIEAAIDVLHTGFWCAAWAWTETEPVSKIETAGQWDGFKWN
eukprot:7244541-Prymnesium_polylepis.1